MTPVNVLTQTQVEALAIKAGFVPTNAKIAGAVALCETPYLLNGVAHSNFSAVGDQALADATWGYSYGGFQIRSLRAQKGTGKWRDEDRLLDPLFNTKAARYIKITEGWNAWSVYKSGMYKAYLQDDFPPPPGTYMVVSGDTLSKIAVTLDAGFTWEQLAAANGIVSPYTIFIGQLLLLPTTKTGV